MRVRAAAALAVVVLAAGCGGVHAAGRPHAGRWLRAGAIADELRVQRAAASRYWRRTALRAQAVVRRGVVGVEAVAGEIPAVWRAVAHCESTDHWNDDTGNGYYGGLQFAEGTWLAYGGGAYAGTAAGASALQQVTVARRVLANQGPGAWPVCSLVAGLSRGD